MRVYGVGPGKVSVVPFGAIGAPAYPDEATAVAADLLHRDGVPGRAFLEHLALERDCVAPGRLPTAPSQNFGVRRP